MPILPARSFGAIFLFPFWLGVFLNCILFTRHLSLRLYTGVLEYRKHRDGLRDKSDMLSKVRIPFDFHCLPISVDVGKINLPRSGYACMTGSAWPWYSTDLCGYNSPKTTIYEYTSSISDGAWTTLTWDGVAGINAYGMQIRYQANDFQTSAPKTSNPGPVSTSTSHATLTAAETESSPGSGTAGTTVTMTGLVTSTASFRNGVSTITQAVTKTETEISNAGTTESGTPGSPGSSSSSSSLSPGAIAGIVVGSVMGVLLVVLIGVLAYRLRLRKNPPPEKSPYNFSDKEIILDRRIPPVFSRAELLGDDGAKEMHAPSKSPVELPGEVYSPQNSHNAKPYGEK
ncbi:hypothetical protein PISL3812_09630 [Talaromyces islandicus]|uniref:Mid2 domain-containing protein n=1 Tax=Talaromyces islandicus TaxID=28573 RepID=A0A0U1MAE5_TALIS|nr:hypothetical protein PISL3812_09630 [Talaromyces islandicus]